MDLRGYLPVAVALLVVFVLFRIVLGAIKMSAKLVVWGLIAVALGGLGYVWYQHQNGEAAGTRLPSLNISGERDSLDRDRE